MGNEEAILKALLEQGQELGRLAGLLEEGQKSLQGALGRQDARLDKHDEAIAAALEAAREAANVGTKAHQRISKMVGRAKWTGGGLLAGMGLTSWKYWPTIKALFDHVPRP